MSFVKKDKKRINLGIDCDKLFGYDHKLVNVDLSKVDWKLLRKQKAALVGLSFSKQFGSPANDILEGIISLLDEIQDQAAEQIGEKKVFGKDVSAYDKTMRCKTCNGTQFVEDGLCPDCGI